MIKLEDKIIEAIATIMPDMITNIITNLLRRTQLCIKGGDSCNGSKKSIFFFFAEIDSF